MAEITNNRIKDIAKRHGISEEEARQAVDSSDGSMRGVASKIEEIKSKKPDLAGAIKPKLQGQDKEEPIPSAAAEKPAGKSLADAFKPAPATESVAPSLGEATKAPKKPTKPADMAPKPEDVKKDPGAALDSIEDATADIPPEKEDELAPYKATLTDLNTDIEELKGKLKSRRDQAPMLRLVAGLSDAIAQYGAARYGLKHGVDMSGVKGTGIDVDAILKDRINNLKTEVDEMKGERTKVEGAIEKLKAAKAARDEKQRGREFESEERSKDRALKKDLAKMQAVAREAVAEGKLSKEDFARTMKLSKTFGEGRNRKIFDGLAEVNASYANIKALTGTDDPAAQRRIAADMLTSGDISKIQDVSAMGDLGLIFSYMKMLDPGSVVRESEQALAIESKSIPDALKSMAKRAWTGQKLTETQRKQMLQEAAKLHKGRVSAAVPVIKDVKRQTEAFNLDPDLVIPSDLRGLLSDDEGGDGKSEAKTDENSAARAWAKANPDDPRAAEILKMIGE